MKASCPISFGSCVMLFSRVRLGAPRVVFLLSFPTKTPYGVSPLHNACSISLSHFFPPQFNHHNGIFFVGGIKATRLFIMQFASIRFTYLSCIPPVFLSTLFLSNMRISVLIFMCETKFLQPHKTTGRIDAPFFFSEIILDIFPICFVCLF